MKPVTHGSSNVASAADKVESHPVLQNGARAGYALNGVLHLMIAWIALQIAWIASGKSADQSGALQTLAGSSLGRLALWVAVLGFLALGLWQLASAVAVRTRGKSSQWADKVKGISKAVVYLALAWTSFSFAKGQPSSSKAQSADFTATLLQHPGGRLLVAVIGLVIIGIGGYHVVKGWTKKFLTDLSENPRRASHARRGHRLHRQGHRPGPGGGPVRHRGGAELSEQGHRTRRRPALAASAGVRAMASDCGRAEHRRIWRLQLRARQARTRLIPTFASGWSA